MYSKRFLYTVNTFLWTKLFFFAKQICLHFADSAFLFFCHLLPLFLFLQGNPKGRRRRRKGAFLLVFFCQIDGCGRRGSKGKKPSWIGNFAPNVVFSCPTYLLFSLIQLPKRVFLIRKIFILSFSRENDEHFNNLFSIYRIFLSWMFRTAYFKRKTVS